MLTYHKQASLNLFILVQ